MLTAAAIAGLVLGAQGWAHRHAGLVGATAGGLTVHGSTSSASSTPGGHSSGSAVPGKADSSPPGRAGPLLSSEPYAQYAYQVWPGTPRANAEQAMTGLSITVSPQQRGIVVRAGVKGQPSPAAHIYSAGARVYVVETALGDDSGNDYNLGDDGLVVTDAEGRIVQ